MKEYSVCDYQKFRKEQFENAKKEGSKALKKYMHVLYKCYKAGLLTQKTLTKKEKILLVTFYPHIARKEGKNSGSYPIENSDLNEISIVNKCHKSNKFTGKMVKSDDNGRTKTAKLKRHNRKRKGTTFNKNKLSI